MTKFGLFGKITTHSGKRDEFVQILLEAAAAAESYEGCELYVVNISDNELDAVWVTEIWADEAAHQASLTFEGTKQLISRGKPLIAGFAEQVRFRPVGGKGLK
ncbi:MAG: antibiotic biosynthesis monooxygenase [Bacilli bacterium]|nr:antibiotic biosynthesis monooxygenase [Bacilli bacterium]